MQYVRTIGWIFLTAFTVTFVVINWGEAQRVKIWPSADGDTLGFDWPVGVIAIVFLLLGLIPMWLYHRSVKWHLNRRISSLENAVRSNALTARHNPPSADSAGEAAPAGDILKPGDN